MISESIASFLRTLTVTELALGIGVLSAIAAAWFTRHGLKVCESPPWPDALLWGLIAGAVAAGLTVAMLQFHCQETPDVRPLELWWRLRPVFHAVLIVLLAAATATDLKTYWILDSVTLTGMVLGLGLATLSGDLQLCHVWVDWNAEIPQLRGPYIPAWLGDHPHWHGLAWSATGLIVGAGLTWAARIAAAWLLGQESLGFGDVTLMGMIGAFVGWQAAVLVFLLAPLCAIVFGLLVRLFYSRRYVPYGPYLSLAAVLLLFFWRRIWMLEWPPATEAAGRGVRSVFALRRLFGDWQGLLILAGMMGGGVVLLLGAWRLYRSLPTGDVIERRGRAGRATPVDVTDSREANVEPDDRLAQ